MQTNAWRVTPVNSDMQSPAVHQLRIYRKEPLV
jgi:hypothetical protein